MFVLGGEDAPGMRFLHTADWHLGRSLGDWPLLEDQARVLLDQLPAMVRDARPDAILVAGDVFDRAVPPAEAVELLDEILHALVRGIGVPVVVIPGNHDAAARLSFGARLLAAGGLHIVDAPLGAVTVLGGVDVVALPYLTPLALAAHGDAAFGDHDAAYAWLVPMLHQLCCERRSRPRMLVAHAFVAGGADCESERALVVGGSGQVAAARFVDFDYVALGHLHRPQTLGEGRLRYAGSPLVYSKSEVGEAKSATLVELRDGAVHLRELPFAPPRAVRCLDGTLEALLREPASPDLVFVTLHDTTPVVGAQRRLAERFPHIVSLRQQVAPAPSLAMTTAVPTLAPLELFAAFHEAMRGRELDEAARPVVAAAVTAAERDAA